MMWALTIGISVFLFSFLYTVKRHRKFFSSRKIPAQMHIPFCGEWHPNQFPLRLYYTPSFPEKYLKAFLSLARSLELDLNKILFLMPHKIDPKNLANSKSMFRGTVTLSQSIGLNRGLSVFRTKVFPWNTGVLHLQLNFSLTDDQITPVMVVVLLKALGIGLGDTTETPNEMRINLNAVPGAVPEEYISHIKSWLKE